MDSPTASRGTSIAAPIGMPNDAEQSLHEIKEELRKLHQEVAELRSRVATLEAERARNAAESLEASF
jgi:uncharacterized small protein (DUF1192 family)